jgi:hypothetical protein
VCGVSGSVYTLDGFHKPLPTNAVSFNQGSSCWVTTQASTIPTSSLELTPSNPTISPTAPSSKSTILNQLNSQSNGYALSPDPSISEKSLSSSKYMTTMSPMMAPLSSSPSLAVPVSTKPSPSSSKSKNGISVVPYYSGNTGSPVTSKSFPPLTTTKTMLGYGGYSSMSYRSSGEVNSDPQTTSSTAANTIALSASNADPTDRQTLETSIGNSTEAKPTLSGTAGSTDLSTSRCGTIDPCDPPGVTSSPADPVPDLPTASSTLGGHAEPTFSELFTVEPWKGTVSSVSSVSPTSSSLLSLPPPETLSSSSLVKFTESLWPGASGSETPTSVVPIEMTPSFSTLTTTGSDGKSLTFIEAVPSPISKTNSPELFTSTRTGTDGQPTPVVSTIGISTLPLGSFPSLGVAPSSGTTVGTPTFSTGVATGSDGVISSFSINIGSSTQLLPDDGKETPFFSTFVISGLDGSPLTTVLPVTPFVATMSTIDANGSSVNNLITITPSLVEMNTTGTNGFPTPVMETETPTSRDFSSVTTVTPPPAPSFTMGNITAPAGLNTNLWGPSAIFSDVYYDGSIWEPGNADVGCKPPCCLHLAAFTPAVPIMMTWPPYSTHVLSLSGSAELTSFTTWTSISGSPNITYTLCRKPGGVLTTKPTVLTLPPFTVTTVPIQSICNYGPTDGPTYSILPGSVQNLLPPTISMEVKAGELWIRPSHMTATWNDPSAALCSDAPVAIQMGPTVTAQIAPPQLTLHPSNQENQCNSSGNGGCPIGPPPRGLNVDIGVNLFGSCIGDGIPFLSTWLMVVKCFCGTFGCDFGCDKDGCGFVCGVLQNIPIIGPIDCPHLKPPGSDNGGAPNHPDLDDDNQPDCTSTLTEFVTTVSCSSAGSTSQCTPVGTSSTIGCKATGGVTTKSCDETTATVMSMSCTPNGDNLGCITLGSETTVGCGVTNSASTTTCSQQTATHTTMSCFRNNMTTSCTDVGTQKTMGCSVTPTVTTEFCSMSTVDAVTLFCSGNGTSSCTLTTTSSISGCDITATTTTASAPACPATFSPTPDDDQGSAGGDDLPPQAGGKNQAMCGPSTGPTIDAVGYLNSLIQEFCSNPPASLLLADLIGSRSVYHTEWSYGPKDAKGGQPIVELFAATNDNCTEQILVIADCLSNFGVITSQCEEESDQNQKLEGSVYDQTCFGYSINLESMEPDSGEVPPAANFSSSISSTIMTSSTALSTTVLPGSTTTSSSTPLSPSPDTAANVLTRYKAALVWGSSPAPSFQPTYTLYTTKKEVYQFDCTFWAGQHGLPSESAPSLLNGQLQNGTAIVLPEVASKTPFDDCLNNTQFTSNGKLNDHFAFFTATIQDHCLANPDNTSKSARFACRRSTFVMTTCSFKPTDPVAADRVTQFWPVWECDTIDGPQISHTPPPPPPPSSTPATIPTSNPAPPTATPSPEPGGGITGWKAAVLWQNHCESTASSHPVLVCTAHWALWVSTATYDQFTCDYWTAAKPNVVASAPQLTGDRNTPPPPPKALPANPADSNIVGDCINMYQFISSGDLNDPNPYFQSHLLNNCGNGGPTDLGQMHCKRSTFPQMNCNRPENSGGDSELDSTFWPVWECEPSFGLPSPSTDQASNYKAGIIWSSQNGPTSNHWSLFITPKTTYQISCTFLLNPSGGEWVFSNDAGSWDSTETIPPPIPNAVWFKGSDTPIGSCLTNCIVKLGNDTGTKDKPNQAPPTVVCDVAPPCGYGSLEIDCLKSEFKRFDCNGAQNGQVYTGDTIFQPGWECKVPG